MLDWQHSVSDTQFEIKSVSLIFFGIVAEESIFKRTQFPRVLSWEYSETYLGS
jgi:hypothetical protein